MSKNLQVSSTYIIMHMGLIFFLYPLDVIECANEAHWIPVLAGYLFHILMISIYLKGLSYFKGESIVSILMKKNKWLAWLALLPLLIYLMWIIVLCIRALAEVISIAFLSNTPLWILMLLLLAISGYMTLHGKIGGLLRLSVLFSVLFAVPMVFVLVSSFQNVDWHYLFPIWPETNALTFLGHPAFYKSLFAYTGGFLMLGFLPPTAAFKPKSIFWASLILLPVYLISVYIPVLKLGEETARQLQFPYIFAVDTVEINWLMFERVNVFLLLTIVAFCMLFVAVTIWQIICIFQQGIKELSSNVLIPSVICITYITCLTIPDWKEVDSFFQWNTGLRLYVAITTPSILLCLGWLHASKMKPGLKSS
ncbi:GerAB/ArcD/ProY family transporter [Paenibacillus sp. MMO-58]|uniref:GerAB/ArcD/ProY family transporter n=1 Tax=Paenibacillus sp. MMO-58 TaxID=3081290 RepID=UPI0030176A98